MRASVPAATNGFSPLLSLLFLKTKDKQLKQIVDLNIADMDIFYECMVIGLTITLYPACCDNNTIWNRITELRTNLHSEAEDYLLQV